MYLFKQGAVLITWEVEDGGHLKKRCGMLLRRAVTLSLLMTYFPTSIIFPHLLSQYRCLVKGEMSSGEPDKVREKCCFAHPKSHLALKVWDGGKEGGKARFKQIREDGYNV